MKKNVKSFLQFLISVLPIFFFSFGVEFVLMCFFSALNFLCLEFSLPLLFSPFMLHIEMHKIKREDLVILNLLKCHLSIHSPLSK